MKGLAIMFIGLMCLNIVIGILMMIGKKEFIVSQGNIMLLSLMNIMFAITYWTED